MSAAAVLKITKQGRNLREVPLEGEMILGRGEDCAVRLDDRAISREHVMIRSVGSGYELEKRSDVAPVLVNGQDATRALLKEGDIVSIGPYLVELARAEAKLSQASASSPVGSPVSSKDSDFQPPQAQVADLSDLSNLTNPSSPPNFANLNAENVLDGTGVEAPNESPPTDPLASLNTAPEAAQEVDLVQDSPEPSSPFLSNAESEPPVFDLSAAHADVPQAPEELPAFSLEGTKTRVVAPGVVESRLSVRVGSATPSELSLEKTKIVIGRGSECDLILEDKKSSRVHVVLEREGAQYILKDQGSANGTGVNGERVTQHALSDGDVIQIGETQIAFESLNRDYLAQEAMLPAPAPIPTPPPFTGQTHGFDADAIFSSGVTQSAPVEESRLLRAKKSLIAKIEAMPPRRRFTFIALIVVALYLAFFDDTGIAPPAPEQGRASRKLTPGEMKFAQLPADKQNFIRAQHQLAFDYYRNREYDKALFELDRIFALVPDYKDAREIERYAKEGKRKLEALEEERRKKEEDRKLRARITQLVDETRRYMQARQYEKAKYMFSEILALDPDHPVVAEWKQDLDQWEQEIRLAEQRKQIEKEINSAAWAKYNAGMKLYSQGAYIESIPVFRSVLGVDATDRSVHAKARSMIARANQKMDDEREPLLSQARELEASGEYGRAYEFFVQAARIDPRHAPTRESVDRLRKILNARAKTLYTEGVLAESYSDFETAKAKYEEITRGTPSDDIYFERAKRKLERYLKFVGSGGAE